MTSRRRWWTLVGVALATFMTFLDNNVVNVALPSIQRELHLSISGLEWIVSSYILVFSGLMLAGGRLADVYGRRRLFVAGITLFTGASLLAGLAGSQEILVFARVLRSLGFGKVEEMIARVEGMLAAAPRPCSTRANTRIS
jgi:MFS family permease